MSQTMLYRCPGPHEIHGGKFDHITVDDSEIEATIADGWFLTTPEAKDAHAASLTEPANTPATRAELEQKAVALGIKFDGRTSDKKLGDLIAATLED